MLFHDFETLDAFGPVEIFSRIDEYRLRFLSAEGGMIQSRQGTAIATESVGEADHTGILLVPGGQGTRSLVNDTDFTDILRRVADRSAYCLTVCTGSALLAKTGLLDCRKATSNKHAFDWVRSVNTKVDWVSCARWVVDGKFYTSSGVSAGMDMSLGFIRDRFGNDTAGKIADGIEYLWNSDKESDPFARQKK